MGKSYYIIAALLTFALCILNWLMGLIVGLAFLLIPLYLWNEKRGKKYEKQNNQEQIWRNITNINKWSKQQKLYDNICDISEEVKRKNAEDRD